MNYNIKFFIPITIFLIESIIGIILEINSLSYLLSLLNSIILPITLLTAGNNNKISNILMQLGIIIYISFYTYNILIWYISFELVIIPMIYLISKGSGSIYYKYRAIYRFSLYTIIGGLLLLYMTILIVLKTGSLNYWYYIINNNFSIDFQLNLFFIAIIPYLIKLPIIPFHIWLPDTHGEASTSGSVYLAAILLKLGGLGIIRWLIPILPIGYLYYRPILLILGIISAIYASIISLRHIDIKKLIAYSSISHMGLILVGITNLNKLSIYGTILLLISHGLVSSLLFILIGLLYVRTKTRYLYYISGLSTIMPLYSTFLLIALLLNASLPPSLSYLSELHILLSQFIAGFYSILLYCRISFNMPNLYKYKDILITETYISIILIILSFSLSFIL